MTYYLIGIGGAGMNVVAELLHAEGHTVLGSDAKDSSVIGRLVRQGIGAAVGHDPARLAPGMTVVVSTAIHEDNPELVRARELGLPVIHRSEALALAAGNRDFVAVAGAHGKTTTSGMLAVALHHAGLDPSIAIGGSVVGYGSGAHRGEGNILVAEADESDRSFLNYTPRVALVTNVEPDHLDFFGSEEEFRAAFVEFVRRIVPGGLLIGCADDPGAADLLAAARAEGIRTVGYGERGPDVFVADSVFELGGARYPVQLRVRGEHNLVNAAGALAAGIELGVSPETMVEGLEMFTGTGRRFEAHGMRRGVRVIDDYAHHPTEVIATIRTARQVSDGRVLVLFQPHLYSRTQQFAERFAHALDGADAVVVTDIFGSREDPIPGVTSRLITDRMRRGRYEPDRFAAARAIAREARPDDLVITMGAGDVTELADVILGLL
ncbi:MAG TPA: UDP-N-acetylmuramate--L-alanine ligase [Actinomycetaceae bacterium]|nr:UDP-N-acetylmuramate--L-alanine ligase [Actinomycetaceae bacterium]